MPSLADWDAGGGRTTREATFYRRHGKRLLDILVSALALTLLMPLLLVVAVLVRLFLGSPILFRQERSGQGKRAFTILKFRSMTDARDASGNLLRDTERLTRFGRFLRSTSLDELPELWNILTGDMSLVGPRPLLRRYDSYYTEREAMRFEVSPGLTGWAQINGRNDLAWDDRLECDAWYVESCSFWLDVKILLFTVVKVLRRDNVHADPAAAMFGGLDEMRGARGAATPHAAREGEAAAAPITPEINSAHGSTGASPSLNASLTAPSVGLGDCCNEPSH